MIGNGEVALVDRATGYDRLFGPEQMVFFDDMPGLIAAIRALLAEPERRQAIGSAGRQRYAALFNESVVAGYVIEVATGAHDPARYEWPTLLP